MLRHRNIRPCGTFMSVYPQDPTDPKQHSPGCDDSGVFLEEQVISSPETQSKSRLHGSTLKQEDPMRHYSIPTEGADSDDLGLASSSIDSADDLDGDPLPSTLQICPPVPTRQKPPPVPARKSLPNSHKQNKFEVTTPDVPNLRKPPLSKSSSSGEDSNFGEGDIFQLQSFDECSKNALNQQKNDESQYATTRPYHEDLVIGRSQESKTAFLARTLSTSSPPTKNNENFNAMKIPEHSSGLKWKSEECLRTAAESKWSLTGRRYEKAVSVKDRIAMFSEMEINQSNEKKDLQRYGSENNIKSVATAVMAKKVDLPIYEENKNCLSRDSKWQSLHNINKKAPEVLYRSASIKPAMSIPSLTSNSSMENLNFAPIKLEVEPPKPIISTYPETQLTNNKRYNYGLYSLKNLKTTEDLLSKKAAGSNLLSIIDARKQPLGKLKGLVIPDKLMQPDLNKTLPTIVSNDSESTPRDCRRASLPITVVTAASLPRHRNNEYLKQTSLSDPPWKSERSSNTLPKYSPAFKKRSLELPGSSLSPTPPSSLTSPLSPPPSSPSSICSSNASSTLQQNVFQFSLSHSKPVQPLRPEKALMSPPPSHLPSDVEYEGDNSEDSSHSASPMRNAVARVSKENKLPPLPPPPFAQGVVHSFTSSSSQSVALQPLQVETLVKSSVQPGTSRAAVCISKTEIHLRRQSTNSLSSKPKIPASESYSMTHTNEYILPPTTTERTKPNTTSESYSVVHSNEYILPPTTAERTITNEQNGSRLKNVTAHDGLSNGLAKTTHDFIDSLSNGHQSQILPAYNNGTHPIQESAEVPVGKFRACPLNLQEVKPVAKVQQHKSRPPQSDDSEDDDDSHSTLSHRTEATTDDCLSDATTDSFEKPRIVSESSINRIEYVSPNLLEYMPTNRLEYASTNHLEYASTEGYLSDASTTDVSLRRFAYHGSTEEYLSDATVESPDPEWAPNRTTSKDARYKTSRNEPSTTNGGGIYDLRPKRLSQQQTVLQATIEPSGSVQKFKALAEKWEQRTDVISPPPPLPTTATNLSVSTTSPRSTSMTTGLFANTTVSKGKSSTLPPSLMPRNTPVLAERKSLPASSNRSTGLRVSPTGSHDTTQPESNGWSQQYVEQRRDSSSSSSSKTTLKEDNSTPSPVLQDTFDSSSNQEHPVITNGHRTSGLNLEQESWNNEPRNRRGADFSRSEWSSTRGTSLSSYNNSKASVSDIRRSFENGSTTKETEKPALPKKPVAQHVDRSSRASPPVAVPRRHPPCPPATDVEDDSETRRLVDEAQRQLQQETSGSNQFQVLSVLLRREGTDGGSVGITLAGGADYEVKEITVHKVIGGSIADRNGRVHKGDRVLSINGRDVRGVSHGEALHILKAPNPRVLLVLARPLETTQHVVNGTDKISPPSQVQQDVETFLVELQKDATGVGFSIEGGKDSPQGDRPLLIKRLFKGGAADKEGRLEEGDEIMSVNNTPVSQMTRTEAWNFLKKLPEGPVRLQIRKSSPLLS